MGKNKRNFDLKHKNTKQYHFSSKSISFHWQQPFGPFLSVSSFNTDEPYLKYKNRRFF